MFNFNKKLVHYKFTLLAGEINGSVRGIVGVLIGLLSVVMEIACTSLRVTSIK